jgi:hypothetical protein
VEGGKQRLHQMPDLGAGLECAVDLLANSKSVVRNLQAARMTRGGEGVSLSQDFSAPFPPSCFGLARFLDRTSFAAVCVVCPHCIQQGIYPPHAFSRAQYTCPSRPAMIEGGSGKSHAGYAGRSGRGSVWCKLEYGGDADGEIDELKKMMTRELICPVNLDQSFVLDVLDVFCPRILIISDRPDREISQDLQQTIHAVWEVDCLCLTLSSAEKEDKDVEKGGGRTERGNRLSLDSVESHDMYARLLQNAVCVVLFMPRNHENQEMSEGEPGDVSGIAPTLGLSLHQVLLLTHAEKILAVRLPHSLMPKLSIDSVAALDSCTYRPTSACGDALAGKRVIESNGGEGGEQEGFVEDEAGANEDGGVVVALKLTEVLASAVDLCHVQGLGEGGGERDCGRCGGYSELLHQMALRVHRWTVR